LTGSRKMAVYAHEQYSESRQQASIQQMPG